MYQYEYYFVMSQKQEVFLCVQQKHGERIMTNYNLLPDDDGRTRELLRNYIERGEPMPDLLMNIVRNDLIRVMTSVSTEHLDFIHTVVLWLYTEAPICAIGSDGRVRSWIERGGREGMKKEEREAMAYLKTPPHPYHRHLEPICEPTD
jgi:hypothetical protein